MTEQMHSHAWQQTGQRGKRREREKIKVYGQTSFFAMTTLKVKVGCFREGGIIEQLLKPFFFFLGLSGAMASISVRSSTPGSPTHVSSGSNASRRRNGLHDVDLNTFISEEMALHLDNGGTRKRTSAQCGDVITDSPTHKRNRMI